MAAKRHAEVTWEGSLLEGSGKVESTSSGAISDLEVTWASRSEEDDGGRTSPEEKLAAAHASCYSMALSHGLAQAGNAPEKLAVKATSTFVPGTGITEMKLDVTGRSPEWTSKRSRRPRRRRPRTAPSRWRSRATSRSCSTRDSRTSSQALHDFAQAARLDLVDEAVY